jgi:hypothetical protein
VVNIDDINNDLKVCIGEYDLNGFIRLTEGFTANRLFDVMSYIVKKDYYPFVRALGKNGYLFSVVHADMAIKNGSEQMLETLISDCRIPVDASSGALIKRASMVGWTKGVEILLDAGSRYGWDALRNCCLNNYTGVAKALLKRSPELASRKDSECARFAILNNNEALLRDLVVCGAKLGERHMLGAVFVGNPRLMEIVEEQMKKGG